VMGEYIEEIVAVLIGLVLVTALHALGLR
jgi:hypothetical protein